MSYTVQMQKTSKRRTWFRTVAEFEDLPKAAQCAEAQAVENHEVYRVVKDRKNMAVFMAYPDGRTSGRRQEPVRRRDSFDGTTFSRAHHLQDLRRGDYRAIQRAQAISRATKMFVPETIATDQPCECRACKLPTLLDRGFCQSCKHAIECHRATIESAAEVDCDGSCGRSPVWKVPA